MPIYEYAWATGHNVALLDLINVETDLKPYTNGRLIAPMSQPVDMFPVQTRMGSGRPRGDGQIDHDWNFPVLPLEALSYIISSKLTTSGVLVQSKAVTILTACHQLEEYQRFNAWLTLPKPRTDYTVRRGFAFDLVLHFTDLIAL